MSDQQDCEVKEENKSEEELKLSDSALLVLQDFDLQELQDSSLSSQQKTAVLQQIVLPTRKGFFDLLDTVYALTADLTLVQQLYYFYAVLHDHLVVFDDYGAQKAREHYFKHLGEVPPEKVTAYLNQVVGDVSEKISSAMDAQESEEGSEEEKAFDENLLPNFFWRTSLKFDQNPEDKDDVFLNFESEEISRAVNAAVYSSDLIAVLAQHQKDIDGRIQRDDPRWWALVFVSCVALIVSDPNAEVLRPLARGALKKFLDQKGSASLLKTAFRVSSSRDIQAFLFFDSVSNLFSHLDYRAIVLQALDGVAFSTPFFFTQEDRKFLKQEKCLRELETHLGETKVSLRADGISDDTVRELQAMKIAIENMMANEVSAAPLQASLFQRVVRSKTGAWFPVLADCFEQNPEVLECVPTDQFLDVRQRERQLRLRLRGPSNGNDIEPKDYLESLQSERKFQESLKTVHAFLKTDAGFHCLKRLINNLNEKNRSYITEDWLFSRVVLGRDTESVVMMLSQTSERVEFLKDLVASKIQDFSLAHLRALLFAMNKQSGRLLLWEFLADERTVDAVKACFQQHPELRDDLEFNDLVECVQYALQDQSLLAENLPQILDLFVLNSEETSEESRVTPSWLKSISFELVRIALSDVGLGWFLHHDQSFRLLKAGLNRYPELLLHIDFQTLSEVLGPHRAAWELNIAEFFDLFIDLTKQPLGDLKVSWFEYRTKEELMPHVATFASSAIGRALLVTILSRSEELKQAVYSLLHPSRFDRLSEQEKSLKRKLLRAGYCSQELGEIFDAMPQTLPEDEEKENAAMITPPLSPAKLTAVAPKRKPHFADAAAGDDLPASQRPKREALSPRQWPQLVSPDALAARVYARSQGVLRGGAEASQPDGDVLSQNQSPLRGRRLFSNG